MVGDEVRRVRFERTMTAAELARRAHVSRSLISQIEKNQSSPSVEVMLRIAEALDVPIGAFFGTTSDEDNSLAPVRSDGSDKSRPPRVVRSDERKTISLPKSHVQYELLSPDLQGRLELIRMVIQVGDASGTTGYAHYGEESFYIEKGRARFHYGEARYELEEGDTITISCLVPHRIENIGGGELIAICAGSPPTF